MRGSALLSFVVMVGLAAGCDIPQATIDDVTCTDLCNCLFALPSSQANCKTQCLAQITPIADDCADCVAEANFSCPTTIDCVPTCVSTPTPLEGEP